MNEHSGVIRTSVQLLTGTLRVITGFQLISPMNPLLNFRLAGLITKGAAYRMRLQRPLCVLYIFGNFKGSAYTITAN